MQLGASPGTAVADRKRERSYSGTLRAAAAVSVSVRPLGSSGTHGPRCVMLIALHRNLMVRVKQGGGSLAHIMTCSHDSHHVLENVAGGALG